MAILTPFETFVLTREIGALHVFSDTMNARGASDARDPRAADFDAPITTDFRSLRLRNDTRDSIARNPMLGAYGAELVAQLHDEALRLARRIEDAGASPEAGKRARAVLEETTRQVVVNCAFRNGVEGRGTNGEDFFLGITFSGIEIYATPLRLLSFCRDTIVSLFRVPNAGHPLFDGDREQFRSSLIALSRSFPEHLERVYGYEGRAALLAALDGGEENAIPRQEHPLQVAFIDRYGNCRIRVREMAPVRALLDAAARKGGQAHITIGGGAHSARVATCLDEVPPDALGVYENVADISRPDGSGYIEVVRKFPAGGGEEEVAQDAATTLGVYVGMSVELAILPYQTDSPEEAENGTLS